MVKVKITGDNFNVELSYYGNMKQTAAQQCEKELKWYADMIRKNNFKNHKIEISTDNGNNSWNSRAAKSAVLRK